MVQRRKKNKLFIKDKVFTTIMQFNVEHFKNDESCRICGYIFPLFPLPECFYPFFKPIIKRSISNVK